jgi:hypothetical protein
MKVRPHLGFIGIGEDNMQFRTSWIGGTCGDKDEGAVAERRSKSETLVFPYFPLGGKKP